MIRSTPQALCVSNLEIIAEIKVEVICIRHNRGLVLNEQSDKGTANVSREELEENLQTKH